jgi:hypothetical protein
VVSILAAASNAAAQQFKAVDAKDSLVMIDLPELTHHARSYSYGQRADYTVDFHYGAALPRSRSYPRLQVVLDQPLPTTGGGRRRLPRQPCGGLGHSSRTGR